MVDLLSGASRQVGRYFSVLSVLPSFLLMAYVFALASSGAWTGDPDWSEAATGFGDLELSELVQLALAALLIGLVLQPLQYALVQLFEGYWGTKPLAVRLMTRRIDHHRRERDRLHFQQGDAAWKLEQAGQDPGDGVIVERENLHHLVLAGEAERLLARFPREPNDVRPTRLGNVLRRYEADAGRQYGLSAVVVVPHLAQVAAAEDVAYVDDQRTSLDLAVRLAVVAGIATCVSVIFLWRAGPWLLLTLVPYSLTYAFYRGAVVGAGGYGVAFSMLIDLNRFRLYERLGVRRPASTRDEQDQNADLIRLLRGSTHVNLSYAPSRNAESQPS